MVPDLLHYRPWRGRLYSPWRAAWPVARTALGMMFRHKLFWVLYALSLLFFFLFFFGQYLIAWAESQAAGEKIALFPGMQVRPEDLILWLRRRLGLEGSEKMFAWFFRLQASMVVVVLAMAGSVLVGNDFRHGSLAFYLSKPLPSWLYVLGKCLAVAVIINLMTALPATVLFVQFGLLTSWDYFLDNGHLLAGIWTYGLLLTGCLSLLLVATASWLRRTVPMIMMWTMIFVFLRSLGLALVFGLRFPWRWELIDLWNSLSLLGQWCLGVPADKIWPAQHPALHEAALVVVGVCLVCVIYLTLRIRAVEIVR